MSFNDDDNTLIILERFLLVTVMCLLRGIGFYERRMRTSLDTQLLGLTEQGYRTVELYNSPARIIKRNAHFRAFLYNNGVYYYLFQEVKQLQNEIDKLSRLRHPRIVRFHGSEQKGDVLYLFLDFMAGVRVFFNPYVPIVLDKVYLLAPEGRGKH